MATAKSKIFTYNKRQKIILEVVKDIENGQVLYGIDDGLYKREIESHFMLSEEGIRSVIKSIYPNIENAIINGIPLKKKDISELAYKLTFNWVSEEKDFEQNIVKSTSYILNISYKKLGEIIGVKSDSLRNIASKEEVSEQVTKSIELYKKTLRLEEEIEKHNSIKQTIKDWLN